jgi:prepilin-type N-terminal cleavage/methylation domain-containing protein
MGATRQTARRQSATTGHTAGSPGRGGFTLTELLVVIGIGVLLMGLLVPTGRALRAGNRALTCKAQLQQIGTALKAYYYDEDGAPPFYIGLGEDPTDAEANPPTGPGLMALYEAGYLAKRGALHCPRDVYTEPGADQYFESYQQYDPDAAANVDLNRYSYLSTRGITDESDPLFYKQLMPADEDTTPPLPEEIGPTHQPDDEAVATWCPFHVPELEVDGEGAYQVLFWDGSVQRFQHSVLTDPAYGPDAAWKVGYEGAG